MFIQNFARSLSVSTRFSIEKKDIDQFLVYVRLRSSTESLVQKCIKNRAESERSDKR